MTLDTIFDLAALTKPIATATALMVLVDQGKIDLDERVVRYLPEFRAHGKEAISIRQLLTLDTIFDLASLTKPIATATALMVLVDQGKIDLDERVVRYLPEFRAHGKEAI